MCVAPFPYGIYGPVLQSRLAHGSYAESAWLTQFLNYLVKKNTNCVMSDIRGLNIFAQ